MRRPGDSCILLLVAVWLLSGAAFVSAAGGTPVVTGPSLPGPAASTAIAMPQPKDGRAAAPPVPSLSLRTGVFSPPAGIEPSMGQELVAARKAGSQSGVYLLICRVPTQRTITQDLLATGVQVLGQYPGYTYVIRGDRARLQTVAAKSYRHWLGRLPAAYKIHPALAGALSQQLPAYQAGKATVNVYDPADLPVVQERLQALGAASPAALPDSRALRCGLTARQAALAAQWPEVSFIEPVPIERTLLATSVGLCGRADYVRDNYNYGSDVVVGMIDTGVCLDHRMFAAYPPYHALSSQGWNVTSEGDVNEDPGGHGTHVAGIMLGRGATIAGICPWLGNDTVHRLRYVKTGVWWAPGAILNADQAINLLTTNNTALVINNSWGSMDASGLDYDSRLVDQSTWDTGQCWVFSAGNSGELGPGSIGSPGAAKNIVAVGSLLNDPTLARSYFSSEGPTSDGRAKPDIYAPGENIISADAFDLDGFILMSGTSMAAPHVTGAIATFISHYPEAFARKPATMKAALMVTATRHPDLPERTGALNSYELHFAPEQGRAFYGYQGAGDPRASRYTYWEYEVPGNVRRMYVALTWIEPAALAGAVASVYDDVDLYVDEGGDDQGLGEWRSVSSVDNVEFLAIDYPRPGHYHLVASNYWTPQPYVAGVAVYCELGDDVVAAPTNLQASYSLGVVSLSWEDNANNEIGFEVLRRVDDGAWAVIADLAPDSTTFADPRPLPGSINSYQVRAYGSTYTSQSSNIASVQLPGTWSSQAVSWRVDYGDNWDRTGVVTKPGASAVRVHFSVIDTERFYDTLTSTAGDVWSGHHQDVTSLPVSGSSLGLHLVSDYCTGGSFVIDRVDWLGPAGEPAQCQGELFGGEQQATFLDVPPDSPLWPFVEAITREGITQGCSANPPLYCPASPVTRGEMAVFICRAAGLAPYYNSTPTFVDVPSTHPQYAYIEALVRAGITNGCRATGPQYCPGAQVTRIQMAAFLCRACGLAPRPDLGPTFGDVPPSALLYGYVEAVYQAGITSGCSAWPRLYCPAAAVSRGQMAVFLCRAFDIRL